MWVTFEDGTGGYVESGNVDESMRIAEEKTGKKAKSADRIPYPARPILFQKPCAHPCPPFCYTPKECLGKGSCPKNHACSE